MSRAVTEFTAGDNCAVKARPEESGEEEILKVVLVPRSGYSRRVKGAGKPSRNNGENRVNRFNYSYLDNNGCGMSGLRNWILGR